MTHQKLSFLPSIIIAAVLLAAGGILWLYIAQKSSGPRLDEAMSQTLASLSTITAYTQHVETEIAFPDRTLFVEGVYRIDDPRIAYSSISTTTLLIPGVEEKPSFTHQNISIGSDVYTTVETMSPMLKGAIQTMPWTHFKADEIPDSLASIAIAGPTLDNLKLLSHKGSYLTYRGIRAEENWDDEPLVRYSFVLSGRIPPESGTIAALIERIATGTVEVWIRPVERTIRHMVFSNPPYYSTTTISDINSVPETVAPIAIHQ